MDCLENLLEVVVAARFPKSLCYMFSNGGFRGPVPIWFLTPGPPRGCGPLFLGSLGPRVLGRGILGPLGPGGDILGQLGLGIGDGHFWLTWARELFQGPGTCPRIL